MFQVKLPKCIPCKTRWFQLLAYRKSNYQAQAQRASKSPFLTIPIGCILVDQRTTLIRVYTPTIYAEPSVKDEFDNGFQAIPGEYILIIAGDCNGRFGS